MRVLLDVKSRKELFDYLRGSHHAKNFVELGSKMNISPKTLNNWRYNYRKYIPGNLIENYPKKLEILDTQKDNWGAVKAGKIGGKKNVENLKKLWGDRKYSEMRERTGREAIKKLQKKYGLNLSKMAIAGRIKKRGEKSEELERKNEKWFTNQKIILDISKINYSKKDKKKKIMLPTEMSAPLAEEIGVHLGDGCLSIKKNYFSVKTNKVEEKYMSDFLLPLYKKLYNLDLKLMRLKSVSGFESYSQALYEFKNKVLSLPSGEKIHKIEIPSYILDSRNKEVYRACIRGLFDTDGFVNIVKSKNSYPIISITIKSEKLMSQVKDMLTKLGFIPALNKWTLNLSGYAMVDKWVKEINSNNPKNLAKLQPRSVVDSTRPCGGLNPGSNPGESI